MDVRITFHALERYAVHHPAASHDDLRAALQRALELDPATALPLVGRNSARPTSSRYFLAEDRRGLFVVEDDVGASVLITYLRFGPWQTGFSRRLWPCPDDATPVEGEAVDSRLGEMLPYVGLPVSELGVAPELVELYGSDERARAALLDATPLSSAPGVHLLQVGPHRVRLVHAHSRWTASLEEA